MNPLTRACLWSAAAVWAGVLAGHLAPRWVVVATACVVVVVGLGAVAGRRSGAGWAVSLGLVAVATGLGFAVGLGQRVADTSTIEALAGDPGGPVVVTGVLATDGRRRPAPGRGWYGSLIPSTRDEAPWAGPRLLLSVDEGEPLPVGTRVQVEGTLRPGSVPLGGRPTAGVLAVADVSEIGEPAMVLRVADALRARTHDAFAGIDGTGADLVVGFLIGDVDALSPVVAEELRLAGLSHYVAVSGSNVAIFLAGWWVVTLPLAIRPRTRWAVGLVGLALFVLVTRWEPSVVRASAMAGLFLVARRAGVVLAPAAVLGLAVAGTLLVVPAFAANLGFQLSVAATGGLLVGFSSGSRGGVAGALRATVAAQLAVAPLLLLRTGSVPLVAPLANLVAAPLVSAATVVGGLAAVLGWSPPARVAAWLADLVAVVGRVAAPFPGLGWTGLVAVVAAGFAWRSTRWRPLVAALVVGVAGLLLASSSTARPGPWVAFLDVGQGDAAIVKGTAGEVVLVDGGPDPVVLAAALRRHGIRRIDLVVVSHRHADHVVGLDAVIGRLPTGEVWHPVHREWGALAPVLAAIDAAEVPRRTPAPGEVVALGSLRIEVLGPLRRYVSPNDESLVVRMVVGGVDILFSGDIEVPAQTDLGPLPAAVVKVPHQGAATSRPEWLEASAGTISVVSVGPNTFGHPVPWVLEALAATGSLVCRTDRGGDVVVSLAGHGPVVLAGCRE